MCGPCVEEDVTFCSCWHSCLPVGLYSALVLTHKSSSETWRTQEIFLNGFFFWCTLYKYWSVLRELMNSHLCFDQFQSSYFHLLYGLWTAKLLSSRWSFPGPLATPASLSLSAYIWLPSAGFFTALFRTGTCRVDLPAAKEASSFGPTSHGLLWRGCGEFSASSLQAGSRSEKAFLVNCLGGLRRSQVSYKVQWFIFLIINHTSIPLYLLY